MQQVERIVLSNPNVETAFATAGSSLSMRGDRLGAHPLPGRGAASSSRTTASESTLEVIGDLRRAALAAARARRRGSTQIDLVTRS